MAFPAADAEKELNPGHNKNFQVDSVSSAVSREKAEEAKKKREKEKKDAMQSLKSTIIVSGIVVAVLGAIYAITKNIRDK
ncbi:hypothetical protein LguiA_032363 [Lonicera macranthoides]